MLNPNMVLGWEEVEHDLYEENGYVFGIELDLFNGHEVYYAKSTDKDGNTYYCDLSNDIYKAIKEFNKIVEKNTWLSINPEFYQEKESEQKDYVF